MRSSILKKSLVVSLLSVFAVAQDGGFTNNASIGAEVGTMGIGVDYSKKIASLSDKAILRVSVAGYNYSKSYDDDDVTYDADLKLANLGLLIDYHPFNNGFYLSGGVYYNGNKVDFKATPNAGTYTFNNRRYTANEVGYVKGETNFNKFAPFIGIGYDNSLFGNGKFFLSTKVGAMYQGSADIDLTGVCGPAIAGTAACTDLQNDIEAEQNSLNSDVDSYKWWPVVTIGVTYKF